MYKCLITGGAGFIGSHMAEELLNQGHFVRILDNFSTGQFKNIEHILNKIDLCQGDIRDINYVADCCKDIDIIFHFAAFSSVAESLQNPLLAHDINVNGTLYMLESALKCQVPYFVFASSAAVYGINSTQPKTESMMPEPINPYGLSKLIGELYCQSYSMRSNLKTICLRFFNVYGPKQNPKSQYSGVITNFINSILSDTNPVIYGDGYQTRDFIYVADIVRANIAALNKFADLSDKFNIFNVATGEGKSLHNILECMASITGKNFDITYLPERRLDIRHSIGNISEIKTTLAFTPQTSFIDGLSSLFKECLSSTRVF